MKIICQIGYSKSMGRKKEGQKVTAYINDCECGWGDKAGCFLTSFLDTRKGKLWYLWSDDLEDGDVIRVQALTSVVGAGKDEHKTFEMIYVVDKNASVQEVEVSGVGMKGYPILKGRVTSLGTVSAADERTAEIESFLDDEGFE